MGELKIRTDHKPRPLRPLYDLPSKFWKDFDYLDESDEGSFRFVQYKGVWYDTYDSQRVRVSRKDNFCDMVVNPDHPFASYHAVISDSFFSGVLFKFVGDDEVICATYTC